MLLDKRYNWIRRLGVVLLVAGCVSMFMAVEAKNQPAKQKSSDSTSKTSTGGKTSQGRKTGSGSKTSTTQQNKPTNTTTKQSKPVVSKPNIPSKTFTVNGVSFEMVYVEGGSFMMGSNDGEPEEKPVHRETVSDFYMGQTEVTQALWEAVMEDNPSYFNGERNPVEQVSWTDCITFVTRLNQLTGQRFRLPTEAEWEYAARGGKYSRGYEYSGSDDIYMVGWFDENSGDKTHPVATLQPNELGLYDMSGNVWEWTSDMWSDDYNSERSGSNRVNRGGACCTIASDCRLVYRSYDNPGKTYNVLGLRLAM